MPRDQVEPGAERPAGRGVGHPLEQALVPGPDRRELPALDRLAQHGPVLGLDRGDLGGDLRRPERSAPAASRPQRRPRREPADFRRGCLRAESPTSSAASRRAGVGKNGPRVGADERANAVGNREIRGVIAGTGTTRQAEPGRPTSLSESTIGSRLDATPARSLSWEDLPAPIDRRLAPEPARCRTDPPPAIRSIAPDGSAATRGLRDLVRESILTVDDLIYPMFVYHGTNLRREIASMPGQYQLSLDRFGEAVAEVAELGIPAVILFGIPAHKDARGSAACDDRGIVQEAIRVAKKAAPGLLVITDVCFCEYTDHGHCGPSEGLGRAGRRGQRRDPAAPGRAGGQPRQGGGRHGRAVGDDGRHGRRRSARGSTAPGSPHVPILAYAAKFASGYYGPFRDAAESTPAFGDRRTYQMDPANGDEAIREVALDLAEGADLVMVKPALAYLDIVRRVKDEFGVPVAAYNVSGEYAMVKAAAANGWIDERRVVLETLTGFKRAGADMILTYHAPTSPAGSGRARPDGRSRLGSDSWTHDDSDTERRPGARDWSREDGCGGSLGAFLFLLVAVPPSGPTWACSVSCRPARSRDAEAEADRLDPGWRHEQTGEEASAPVPPEEDAAVRVQAGARPDRRPTSSPPTPKSARRSGRTAVPASMRRSPRFPRTSG